MNTEQLAKYIASPELITNSDIPVLKELSEKHMYSNVLSLLYISAISRLKSIDLDNAIQHHAYRLSDRNRLYHLIHQKEQTEISLEYEKQLVHPNNIVEPIQLDDSNPTDVKEEAIVVDSTDSQFSTETTAFTIEQDYFVGVQKEESVPSERIETRKEAAAVEEPTVEKLVPEEPVVADQIPEKELIVSMVEDSKKSFSDWLRSPQKDSEKDPIKLSKQQIIDQFIQKEPTISRPKAEFFSPSKKAKASLDEDTVPVSETLAKIYAAQGNFPKAIHVYHQLMLSYPEKKSLFAVAIEELKKKITP